MQIGKPHLRMLGRAHIEDAIGLYEREYFQ
jgi:hypothetical protein